MALGYAGARDMRPGETVVGVTSNGVIRLLRVPRRRVWKKVQGAEKMEDIKVKTGHFCELLLYKDALKVKVGIGILKAL